MADNASPELFGQTPWQTVGPFFHYALPWWGGADLTGQSDIGAAPTRLVGHHPALNHSQEWQMPAGEPIEVIGRVLDGGGHVVSDPLSEIWQADADGLYGILGRGLLKRLVTRLYFADSPQNEDDPILDLVPAERRPTLIARRDGEVWRFEIVLSGPNVTVVFDC